jgi:hypothetical protein
VLIIIGTGTPQISMSCWSPAGWGLIKGSKFFETEIMNFRGMGTRELSQRNVLINNRMNRVGEGGRAKVATATVAHSSLPVGLNRKNTLVRESFSTEFQKYLTGLNDWFDYLEGFRHPLAHRIPLYIPPYIVSEDKDVAYRLLENRRMTESDVTEYERLSAEQKALATFVPLMMHSFEEKAKPVVFHSQMLIDFVTVEELAKKILEELDP